MSNQKRSKARQELDNDRTFILWLFDNRCVMCGRPTKIIHEIVPISHGKSSLHWTNRVPLCDYHHTWAHEGTKVSIPLLQDYRVEYLKRKVGIDLEAKRLEFIDSVSKQDKLDGSN